MGLKGVTTLSANLFVTKGNVVKIVQQLKETIMNPKGKKDLKSQSSTMKMVGNDWEDDDDIYVDIEFDDSSEIDYGLEYTQSS